MLKEIEQNYLIDLIENFFESFSIFIDENKHDFWQFNDVKKSRKYHIFLFGQILTFFFFALVILIFSLYYSFSISFMIIVFLSFLLLLFAYHFYKYYNETYCFIDFFGTRLLLLGIMLFIFGFICGLLIWIMIPFIIILKYLYFKKNEIIYGYSISEYFRQKRFSQKQFREITSLLEKNALKMYVTEDKIDKINNILENLTDQIADFSNLLKNSVFNKNYEKWGYSERIFLIIVKNIGDFLLNISPIIFLIILESIFLEQRFTLIFWGLLISFFIYFILNSYILPPITDEYYRNHKLYIYKQRIIGIKLVIKNLMKFRRIPQEVVKENQDFVFSPKVERIDISIACPYCSNLFDKTISLEDLSTEKRCNKCNKFFSIERRLLLLKKINLILNCWKCGTKNRLNYDFIKRRSSNQNCENCKELIFKDFISWMYLNELFKLVNTSNLELGFIYPWEHNIYRLVYYNSIKRSVNFGEIFVKNNSELLILLKKDLKYLEGKYTKFNGIKILPPRKEFKKVMQKKFESFD